MIDKEAREKIRNKRETQEEKSRTSRVNQRNNQISVLFEKAVSTTIGGKNHVSCDR
jgi:hypothetical protein